MEPVVILKGVLPPIAAALLLVSFGGARLISIAAALGPFVAYWLLKRVPPAWPHELWEAPNATEWLLWAIVGAALVTVLEYRRLVRGRSAAGLGVAVACIATWLLLSKRVTNWSLPEASWYVGSGALIAAASVLGHRALLRRASAGVRPAILFTVLLSVDAVVVVTLGSSLLLGQLCGAVAAALGAAVGTTLWRRPFALAVADGTWLGMAHALFVLAGVHIGDLGWPAAACVLAAPLLLFVPRVVR